MSTIFQKIIDKEVPAKIVYEDDDVLAFHDIQPVAKIHILVIPKKAIKNLADVTQDDIFLLGKLQFAIARIAKEEGISEKGYRVITNINEYGGQEVYHLHYHLIGGEPLGALVGKNG